MPPRAPSLAEVAVTHAFTVGHSNSSSRSEYFKDPRVSHFSFFPFDTDILVSGQTTVPNYPIGLLSCMALYSYSSNVVAFVKRTAIAYSQKLERASGFWLYALPVAVSFTNVATFQVLL